MLYANDDYDKIIISKSRFLLKRVYIVNSKCLTKLIRMEIKINSSEASVYSQIDKNNSFEEQNADTYCGSNFNITNSRKTNRQV